MFEVIDDLMWNIGSDYFVVEVFVKLCEFE